MAMYATKQECIECCTFADEPAYAVQLQLKETVRHRLDLFDSNLGTRKREYHQHPNSFRWNQELARQTQLPDSLILH